ncbi:DUF4383 domain-containing protein [bacterium]|nr:DUF4383 domain-containing protein [bacterium]
MKIISYIIGIIVTLAGIIGFFSAPVLGMLETNTIQNVIWIILGLAIIMGTKKGTTKCKKIIGAIFAILGILGIALSGDMVIGIIESTNAVNYFHLIIGIILIIIGFMGCKDCKGDSRGQSINSGEMNMPQQPETPQQPHNPQM